MPYFTIQPKKDLRHEPVLHIDYTKFRPIDICLKCANRIPKLQIIELSPDPSVAFYPMLRTPFFCVNSKVKNAFIAQEPFLITKQLVLIDPLSNRMEHYYMIIADEIDCATVQKELAIDSLKTRGSAVFVAYAQGFRYLIVNEDVRSLLIELAEYIEFHEVRGV